MTGVQTCALPICFPLLKADDMGTTPLATAEQLAIIRRLDPHNQRGMIVKNNPPAIRQAA